MGGSSVQRILGEGRFCGQSREFWEEGEKGIVGRKSKQRIVGEEGIGQSIGFWEESEKGIVGKARTCG